MPATITARELISVTRQISSDAGLLPLRQFDARWNYTSRRDDPIFKLVAGRPPDDPALASQPTARLT